MVKFKRVFFFALCQSVVACADCACSNVHVVLHDAWLQSRSRRRNAEGGLKTQVDESSQASAGR